MQTFIIRKMINTDWEYVSKIYQQGIDTNTATFEMTCPGWSDFNDSHTADCRYVILSNDNIVGWAALSPTSKRLVYRGVADVSIYISNGCKGLGIGTKLLKYLTEQSERAGYWMLQSSIISDNTPSIRLHEKCGFRLVGFREKIGQDRFGVWCDTVLMEKRIKITV